MPVCFPEGILVAQGESPKFNEKAFAELNHTLQGIFGENNARIYGVTAQHRASLVNDRFALAKQAYDREGGDRTNLAYGYVVKKS